MTAVLTRKVTNMNVLYRRFFLFAAMIACMGVLTANLIQQTKRDPFVFGNQPVVIQPDCGTPQMCKTINSRAAAAVAILT